ncbi:MAG: LamG domain-containing protein [Burkholderiales bacterium]|jgi:MSHA biogenesis protein MshQ|nr:LamG domain-containing protein [Burkholderiales bacterium]
MRSVRRFLLSLLLLGLGLLCGLAQAASSYTFRSDSYAWETAANAISTWDKTCTSYPGDDDKATINFSGGFKFRFAGIDYTSVRVLTNGGLQFGTDTGFFRTYTNTALPAGTAGSSSGCAAAATTNVILAYWTDLNPSQAGSGGVTWEQKGTAPNRYLVVSWNGVYQYNTSTPYTFQIILYESSSGVNGEFKFQYGNANATGSQATIGVQVNSSDYTQYSYNSGYNANGSAIRWFVPSGTPTRRAEYRFDEYSYAGRVGEVADSSGNSNNGVRAGAATTVAAGYVCRGLSIPADATSASHGVDTLLDVNSAIGDSGAVTFWYSANTAWNNSAATLLDATTQTAKPFFLVRQGDGSLRATVSDGNGQLLSAVTSAQSVSAGTWKHIAISWRLSSGAGQSSLRIYINGVQAGAASGTTTGSLDGGIGTLFVGDNRGAALPANGTSRSANGTIDEMRVYNYEISALELTADMNPSHTCPPPLDHVEAVPSATAGSTCAPSTVTIRACSDAACNTVMTGYSGTVVLNTSSSHGTWALGSGGGGFSAGASNSGNASYTFSSADQGVARLTLSHNQAQNVTVTAVDSLTPSTATTSAAIQFRDNAFVFSEDAGATITGTFVAVAGRPHDMQISLIKKDASNSNCGVAADFSGTRKLKLWRTDSGGTWTAPSVQSPTLTVGTSRPSATADFAFTNGVATFNLLTTDVGNYSFTVEDDTQTYTPTTISGGSATLTVRPFVIGITGIAMGSVINPGATAPSASTPDNTRFGAAGAPFAATLTAYRWNSTAGDNSGQPLAGATLTQVAAGGVAAGFNAPVTLKLLTTGFTPAGGSPGTLSHASISGGFSGGALTVSNLSYNEVGSMKLDTRNATKVVTGYLGTTGADVSALAFDATGAQQPVVGRFVPAGFTAALLAPVQRSQLSCTPASTFTYLDESFILKFTLTAVNAQGNTTQNYAGSTFARLDLASANFNLAGVDTTGGVTTRFPASRLNVGASAGAWPAVGDSAAGTATVTLTAAAKRAAAPDGPFNTAQFGIAPSDQDGVGMAAFDLDTDAAVPGNDRTKVGQIPLLHGRLRLQNGMSAAGRDLKLALSAQSWNGTAFVTNALDSCTTVTAANLSFGNFRKQLGSADAKAPGSVTVNPIAPTFITLTKPSGNRVGSMDVAIALGAVTSPVDTSCLKTAGGWTAATPATAGLNLDALRGAWCGSTATSDPSARATWGLYRGSDGVVYQRENY